MIDPFVGAVTGLLIGLTFSRRRSALECVASGAALAVPFQLLISPSAELLVPQLAVGALLGLLVPAALRATDAGVGEATPSPTPPPQRIVILGGGFAGLYTALHLEELFAGDPSVDITLVSDANAVLFTPMLAEVAGSSLEPTHISTPLRSSLRRTRVVKGTVTALDARARTVAVDGTLALAYDHAVVALGAVTKIPPPMKQALDFKTLEDAIVIRNRVIALFDEADRETDPARRRALLTFVVAGGGFAGVELAGALNDFARGMLADYPGLAPEDVQVVLVHSRDRILPELSEPLGRYALERMQERGVVFKLNARLAEATDGSVRLEPGETIAARTLVWTAGTGPSPLAKRFELPADERGAILVDGCLAVKDHPGVWALGDVAAVKHPDGSACPPTAQFALREAKAVARNIHATLTGGTLRPFRFAGLGAMCVVGHQVACAELAIPFLPGRHVRFSGLLAWLMWRSVYLSKLPGLERKVRVLIDWVVEVFFPRDIVQTLDVRPEGRRS